MTEPAQYPIAIVACPQRAEHVEKIKAAIGRDVTVFMDEIHPKGDCTFCVNNHIRTLEGMADSRSEWVIVLEDDIEIGDNFHNADRWLKQAAPNVAGVWLYVSDKALQAPGLLPYEPFTTQAVAYRTNHLRPIANFMREYWNRDRKYGTGYAIRLYMKSVKAKAMRTMPSLVDHLDFPSLIWTKRKPPKISVSYRMAKQAANQRQTAASSTDSADACPSGADCQPISLVEWIERDRLSPNDYNPNKQAPTEHRLLKISLLANGWTQPIVVFDSGDGSLVIVDGEHRWRASSDAAVAKLTSGKVPIVRIKGTRSQLMMATIRHNRARGQHGVDRMSEIVAELIKAGLTSDQIETMLQMEDEEVARLAEQSGLPEVVARDCGAEFSAGWIPE